MPNISFPWIRSRKSPVSGENLIMSATELVKLLKLDPSRHWSSEEFWVSHQPFLESRGYMLRPRFRPGWTASWKRDSRKKLNPRDYEDSQIAQRYVIDATTLDGGQKVVLKRVKSDTQEISLATYFSMEGLRSDPRNHCVPILDVILLPGDDTEALLVMPLLREFYSPPFHCCFEVIEALRQFLEGLVFLHEHNIAHKDACLLNLTMDCSKVIPRGYHFNNTFTHDGVSPPLEYHRRCAVQPVRYYFIDFGLSEWHAEGPRHALDIGRYGQRADSVPEFARKGVPFNPFKTDMFQLGFAFQGVSRLYQGLEAMLQPFISRLISENPQDRPSAADALAELDAFVMRLTEDQLREPLIWLKSSWWLKCLEDVQDRDTTNRPRRTWLLRLFSRP